MSNFFTKLASSVGIVTLVAASTSASLVSAASEFLAYADLLADNRLAELAELDEGDLKRLLKSIQESDPSFDLELTGFAEDEIRKLFDAEDPAEDLEIIPRMV